MLRAVSVSYTVSKVRLTPCGVVRLACEYFKKPFEIRLFMRSSFLTTVKIKNTTNCHMLKTPSVLFQWTFN